LIDTLEVRIDGQWYVLYAEISKKVVEVRENSLENFINACLEHFDQETVTNIEKRIQVGLNGN